MTPKEFIDQYEEYFGEVAPLPLAASIVVSECSTFLPVPSSDLTY